LKKIKKVFDLEWTPRCMIIILEKKKTQRRRYGT